MAKSRLELQALLEELIGSRNVYFQPPENVRLRYPCIIYNLDDMEVLHADDIPFIRYNRYSVTVIDKDPDSPIPGRVASLPLCRYDRSYISDNLNHDIFKLYY